MLALSPTVHAALLGAGAAAVAALGMNALAFELAVPARPLAAAVDFIGTPGAAKEAAGRVTDAALGAVDLAGAAALIAELAGAAGAVAGGVVDVILAVIE
jgi:hypothetical protein